MKAVALPQRKHRHVAAYVPIYRVFLVGARSAPGPRKWESLFAEKAPGGAQAGLAANM